jgi:hypothetical protein
MKTLDLDDLPPRLAQLLTSLEAGEGLALVQNGLVVGLLRGAMAPAVEEPEPPPTRERAAEIFEQFRSLMEDEF